MINTKRVVLGGLVVGILNLILTISMAVLILREHIQAQIERYHLEPPPYALFTAITVQLLIGIVIVWLYAAIRPRFGPGPRTAVIAGLVAWFLAYVPHGELMVRLGFSQPGPVLSMLAWGFFQFPLIALVGGWLYREG